MNSAQRFEFQNIREDQDRLHYLIQNLDHRIDVLGRNLIVAPEPAKPKPPEINAAAPPPLPPPPPKPPVVLPSPAAEEKKEPSLPLRVPLLPLPPEPKPKQPTSEPLELRVGTYWMSRIGIVILLTGLVFLGNYAYHLIVPLLGPAGKVSLLLLAGLGLGGAGYWMERSKESLRNFGRVLFAGGAATVYYTTYAAHFVQGLRVIESPLIGGLMLLAVAGGIAWYAERKKSETIASLAVLLSYYTSAINSLTGFTLFSSLLLTALAVYFLIRNNWARLSSLSLFATYGSYAFWRFYHMGQAALPPSEMGNGLGFLAGYWMLFTVAVLFAKPAAFKPAERTSFLTLNNLAFFAFASLHFALHLRDAFWMFSMGFGGVLLGLAAVSAYRDPENSSVDGAYLAQGLIAITAGIAAKFSGPQLSVILALESAALLMCVRRRHGLLYEIAAGLCALGSFGLALERIQLGDRMLWSVGLPVAIVLLFNAWWIKHLRRDLQERLISRRAVVFAVLGLILIAGITWQATPHPWRPSAFALLSILGLAAFRIRLAEVGFGTQLFVPFAGVLVFAQFVGHTSAPWLIAATVIASALGLVHWWQARRESGWNEASNALQLLFSLVAVGVGFCWTRETFQGDAWLTATSLIAVATVAYGLATRAWAVALAGQTFSLAVIAGFIFMLVGGHPAWMAALTPVIAMTLISLAVSRCARSRWPSLGDVSYQAIAQAYRIAGAILLAIWAFEYVPPNWRVVYFAALGAVQIGGGSYLRSQGRVVAGTLYAVAGIALFWMRFTQPVFWQDVLALISIPLALRVGTRLSGESPLPKDLRNVLVTMVLFSVWLWVTRWTLDRGVLGQLTISWTMLALVVFAAGLALRERVYRLGGFIILSLALGRLFVFDVWKFDSLYRIVSFLVLGAALLALSFVYNRFAETLRKVL